MTKFVAAFVVLVFCSPALARDAARCVSVGQKASKLCSSGMAKKAKPDFGPEMSFATEACHITGQAMSLGCERDQFTDAAITYCAAFDQTMRMVIPTICEVNEVLNTDYAHIAKARRAEMCKLAAEYSAAKVKKDCRAK